MVRNPPANAGDMGLIPGSGRYPAERNGYSLQYSCLGSPMDRGAWLAIVLEVAKSRSRPSTHTQTIDEWLKGINTVSNIHLIYPKRIRYLLGQVILIEKKSSLYFLKCKIILVIFSIRQ